MKNLLIFISSERGFPKEHEDLTKIQIDNSFAQGWKLEDIILATNFNFEYRGVKSLLMKDYTVFDQNRSTKIPVINQLFADGVIQDELYWFHDLDAFQLVPFEIELDRDTGFTSHGYSELWNAGSFFFKKSAEGIFLKIWEYMNLRGTNEQNALTYMWENNIDNINDRYRLMNQTYNIGIYHIDRNVRGSEKPIKVLHFHPHKKRHLELFQNRKMIPQSLLTIFNQYGIR